MGAEPLYSLYKLISLGLFSGFITTVGVANEGGGVVVVIEKGVAPGRI